MSDTMLGFLVITAASIALNLRYARLRRRLRLLVNQLEDRLGERVHGA